jgi:hypothetical protein
VQPLSLKEAKDFGHRLFQAVLRDDVYVALRRSLDRSRQEGSRLRLQLNLARAPEYRWREKPNVFAFLNSATYVFLDY